MTRRLMGCVVLGLALLECITSDVSFAAEEVLLTTGQKLIGEVTDFTGKRLEITLSGGLKRSVLADLVQDVHTTPSAAQRQADDLYAEHKFIEAMAAYQGAIQSETRRWVRRQLLARLVRSSTHAQQIAQAGQFFLLLLQDDPDSRDFDALPLAWVMAEPSPLVESQAKKWLAQSEQPVAVLLGASHLLLGPNAPAATTQLQQLTQHADPRIAALAEAQLWRVSIARVTDEQLAHWADKVERMPSRLRAGPYYVLGRAYGFRQQSDLSALNYLRAAILFSEQRPLAAESLLAAAGELHQAKQRAEALRLLDELIVDYGETRAAKESQQRRAEWRPAPAP